MSVLKRLNLSYDELDQLVGENPSLRSFVVGYAAELKLLQYIAAEFPGLLADAGKPDDHDRKTKGDRLYVHDGTWAVSMESKSLQTAKVKRAADGSAVSGQFQCDASDRRLVQFSDGSSIETTCLIAGEFDIVAVNLFEFFGEWRFAFAANYQLPRSKGSKYTDLQRSELLLTCPTIVPELNSPFTWDLEGLVKGMVQRGELKRASSEVQSGSVDLGHAS